MRLWLRVSKQQLLKKYNLRFQSKFPRYIKEDVDNVQHPLFRLYIKSDFTLNIK